MTTDANQHPFKARAWWALKAMLLLVSMFFGLKCLESFLLYSTQAAGVRGLPEYRDLYEVAITGQRLNVAVFLACQLFGGAVLQSMLGRGTASWGERIKSVLLFSLGFALVTGLVVAVIVLVRR